MTKRLLNKQVFRFFVILVGDQMSEKDLGEKEFGGKVYSRQELLKLFGFTEENKEILVTQYGPTGFPAPQKYYQLSWEVYDLSLEEPYFWVLDMMKGSFPHIEKVEDSFAAAENSAFFGVTQQRLGAQQDKISQFLATIGKMIKELFQMVRELRIIDERMTYYEEAESQFKKPLAERSKSAEITLKGMFVDLVQGGGKSAGSVYGMARELEFITLPDLFFDAPPFKDVAELDKHVDNLGADFNKSVLRVLGRHLRQFMEWKKRTHQEHADRQRFMLQYLLQHFEIIKMYVGWVKPYLRHVEKLTFKDKNMRSAEMVSSFEGSMLDVELLAHKPAMGGVNACILVTFNYRTRPELKVVQEGYQRGPVHIGKLEMNLRTYAWTKEEIENYKKFKEKESLQMLGNISKSVQDAMISLGDELDKYLGRARKQKKEEEVKKPAPKKSFAQSFFGEFYTSKKESGPKAPSAKELREKEEKLKAGRGLAKVQANGACWAIYNNFKKSHRMVTW